MVRRLTLDLLGLSARRCTRINDIVVILRIMILVMVTDTNNISGNNNIS